jgi:small subunit ribosomal protein S6
MFSVKLIYFFGHGKRAFLFMKTYELTVVLPEKATAARKKKVVEIIEKIVKTAKGKVKKSDDWGRVELAHSLKGNDSGVFLFFELELEPESVKSLDQKIKLEEDVIRHLLVKKGR